MLRIAIVGGSGYTGLELLRILFHHPEVKVTVVTSRKNEGTAVTDLFPSLSGCYDNLVFSAPSPEKLCASCDLVFTAVPHQAAMAIVPQFLKAGKKTIDLSADFRLRDRQTYEAWYQEHQAPELLDQAVYGLAEVYRNEIARADLVANPGCYPTSTILPLYPLLKEKVVSSQGIIVDSKSGVSGAGRSGSLSISFCEVNEGFKAYKVACHRHTPEIEQELSRVAGQDVIINFTPHLVPMNRGILTTIYVTLSRDLSTGSILEIMSDFYEDKPFVKVLSEGQLPNVSMVRGSNNCVIGAVVDQRTRRAIVVSAIDNLVKGASGQAVQNLNIMMGLDETMGLKTLPVFP